MKTWQPVLPYWWIITTKQTWFILIGWKFRTRFLCKHLVNSSFLAHLITYNNEKFMGNGGVAIVGCHQMGSFPSRPGCYFYRILSTNRFASRNYYWAHDMFSRISWIQIDKFFHQYFSVEKENKILIGQKRHFFSVLCFWENQNNIW